MYIIHPAVCRSRDLVAIDFYFNTLICTVFVVIFFYRGIIQHWIICGIDFFENFSVFNLLKNTCPYISIAAAVNAGYIFRKVGNKFRCITQCQIVIRIDHYKFVLIQITFTVGVIIIIVWKLCDVVCFNIIFIHDYIHTAGISAVGLAVIFMQFNKIGVVNAAV